jgi:hypothetical protein
MSNALLDVKAPAWWNSPLLCGRVRVRTLGLALQDGRNVHQDLVDRPGAEARPGGVGTEDHDVRAPAAALAMATASSTSPLERVLSR